MNRRRTARRSRWRLWSLAALVCFVAAQALATAHDTRTVHVRCAEHGELIELAAVGEVSTASATAHGHLVSTEADAHGHADHEHCAFATLTHGGLVPHVASPAVSEPPSALVAAMSRVADSACAAIALLALAPKTSPPV